MADAPEVHIGENSAEQVAFNLMKLIADVEGKALFADSNAADREWILRTYSQCIRTVRGGGTMDAILEAFRPRGR
jgi:hypothetical protein